MKIGLFCSTPMVEVARAVGRKRAMELLLTGEPIDAPTAADWGLVNRVVAAEELTAATDGARAPDSRGQRRDARDRQAGLLPPARRRPAEAYELCADVMTRNALDADAQEGMCAFLEKRRPVWADR